MCLSFNDEVGEEKRRENGSDHDAVDLPCGPKVQSQPADDLRFQQQESGAHAEEEERRYAGTRLGNLKIKDGREQNDERAEQVEDAWDPVSLVVEIGPIVCSDSDRSDSAGSNSAGGGSGRRGKKRSRPRVDELTQTRIGGEACLYLRRGRNDKAGGVRGITRRREENHGRFSKSAAQHFGEPLSHKEMVDLKLNKNDAVRGEQHASFAEGLFGIDEVVEAHVGVVGELSVGIE